MSQFASCSPDFSDLWKAVKQIFLPAPPPPPYDYHEELGSLPSISGFCNPEKAPKDAKDAISVASKKALGAREVFRQNFADKSAGFLDRAVLDPLRCAKDAIMHNETWDWLYPASALSQGAVSESIHKARLGLELAAENARANFGGLKIGGLLGCAAHDLRYFDPAPYVHPIALGVGR
mmetsp:Transcript_17991/g.44943  ORF Transcript_17991/g.44943 Transcript_17991/m.44943 type:complete len:178 (+) Transcript_17991:288-821(+)